MSDLRKAELFADIFATAVRTTPDGPLVALVEIFGVDISPVLEIFDAYSNANLALYQSRVDSDVFFSSVEGEFPTLLGGEEFDSGFRDSTHLIANDFINPGDWDSPFSLNDDLTTFALNEDHFMATGGLA